MAAARPTTAVAGEDRAVGALGRFHAGNRRRSIGRRQAEGWRDAAIFAGMVLAVIVIARLPSLGYLDYGFGLLVIFSLGSLSVTIIYHYLGEINLGAIAGLAVGGYCYAIALQHGVPAPGGFLLAMVGSAVFGGLMGLPNLRLHGIQLALVTFAAAWALPELITATGSVTGGHKGMVVPATFSVAGATVRAGDWSFVLTAGVVLLVVGLMVIGTLRTAFGRRLLLLSGAEPASRTFGMRIGTWRIAVWVVSGLVAGIAGCFYAASSGFVGPTEFPYQTSLLMMAAGIVGGAGWMGGALVAGVLIGLLPDLLSALTGGAEYVLLGVLIAVAIPLGKDGLVGLVNWGVDWLLSVRRGKGRQFRRHRDGEEARVGAGSAETSIRDGEPVSEEHVRRAGVATREVVTVDEVSLRFGGIDALNDVSVSLKAGEWLALAGPNGSGKSSLLNCISGAYIPTRGCVLMGGVDVTKRSPAPRARLGMGRTFQSPRLAEGLSIAENVWLGSATTSAIASSVRRHGATWKTVYESLDSWNIAEYADELPADVPYGVRKQAELARLSVKAGCGQSKVFLMDEPAAGLSPEERDELVQGLRRLRLLLPDVAVIIVEHDVKLLTQLCDSALAMDSGRQIAQGKVEDVFTSDAVVMSFIGQEGSDEAV